MTTRNSLFIGMIVAFILLSCGDKTPDEEGGQSTDDAGDAGQGDGGDTEDPFAAYANDFFPMGVGWRWVYREVINGDEGNATTLAYEVTSEQTLDIFQYHPDTTHTVFILENTVDSEGKRRIQYIEDDGPPSGKALRLKHEVFKVQDDTDPSDTNTEVVEELTDTRDFVPGFLRFDRTRMLISGESWLEPIVRYSETANLGSSMDRLTYEYTVLDIDATVTAGDRTYPHCIHFRRANNDDTETKEYWHAKGIGKVKELTTDVTSTKIEELIDCSRCN